MMTAFGSPTERGEALRTGAIAYLEKPFDLRALKDQLRRMTAPSSGASAANAGQAEGYDLLEVARVINLARRDIALRVESAGHVGRFRFSGGELIWAESGDLQGDDAFVALTVPRAGRAQPEPWDGHSSRNVMQPLSRLIPLVLAQRDRAPRGETAGPAARTTPQPSPSAAATAGMAGERPAVAPENQASQPGTSAMTGAAPGPAQVFSTPSAIEPTAGTAPVAKLTPDQQAAIQSAVDSLVGQLPEPCGVAFLRPDGGVVTQRWKGDQRDPPSGALLHVAACTQAALRALLIAGWGDLEHVEISSRDRKLLLCRYGRGDRAGLLVLVVPGSEDLAQARGLVEQVGPALNESLR
jgi:hypothetical protein